ncbi:MAG TPA: hypothetical protein DGO89_23410 [Microcoleaceae bacterium UBA9251]|jgi:hypothetical protein|nr:hypothetical protein [Microcoleaceae cyanobacterium UBA9251]
MGDFFLYRFCLHRNVLTAENTEDTEGENRDLNNSDEERMLYPRDRAVETVFTHRNFASAD